MFVFTSKMLTVGFFGWWKGAKLSVIYIFFLSFLYFLISTIISRLFFFFLKFYTRICMSRDIYLQGDIKDPAFKVILRDVKHGVV